MAVSKLSPLLALIFALAACGDTAGGGSDAPSDAGVGASDAQPSSDAGDPPVTLDSSYLFDPENFHSYEVELSAEDWAFLKADPRAELYVPAELVFEGQRYEGAALRFKGGYGSLESCFEGDVQVCPKLSLKVSFTKFGDSRFYGLRKLVFNSSVRDKTMMHEVVGYHLFREMGVEAPRATHARLTVNGEYLGVFVMVEQIDKEFIQDHYANDEGNLYKSVWPQYDEPERYVDALKTNEEVADVSGMLALDSILSGSSDETFESDVEGVLDLDAWASYLAVDRATSNADGIQGFYCYGVGETECENANYYWYEEPGAVTHLIPWDLDYALNDPNEDLGRSFQDHSPEDCEPVSFCEFWGLEDCSPDDEDIFLLPPQCDRLYGKVHRATWTRYLSELERLADGPLSREAIVPYVEGIRSKIRQAVSEDPFGPGLLLFESENESLDETLELQLEAIQTLLAEETP